MTKKLRSNILTVHVPHMRTSISFNRIILTSTATIPMQYVLLIPDFDVLNIHIYIYICKIQLSFITCIFLNNDQLNSIKLFLSKPSQLTTSKASLKEQQITRTTQS